MAFPIHPQFFKNGLFCPIPKQSSIPGERGRESVVGGEAHAQHDPVGPRVDVPANLTRRNVPGYKPGKDNP